MWLERHLYIAKWAKYEGVSESEIRTAMRNDPDGFRLVRRVKYGGKLVKRQGDIVWSSHGKLAVWDDGTSPLSGVRRCDCGRQIPSHNKDDMCKKCSQELPPLTEDTMDFIRSHSAEVLCSYLRDKQSPVLWAAREERIKNHEARIRMAERNGLC